MDWGKVVAIVALSFSLSACATQPQANSTPSSSPSTSATLSPTENPFANGGIQLGPDEADFKNFLTAIVNTCDKSIKLGASGTNLDANAKPQPVFMVLPTKSLQDHNQWFNQLQFVDGKWGNGYWGDGDPLCTEADWAADFLKKKSERKNSALLQENEVRKFGEGFYTLAIHRGGPDMTPMKYQVTEGLISAYSTADWSARIVLAIGLSKEQKDLFEKVTADSGNQNAYLTGKIWGLSEADARKIIEDAGLVFYVAMIDNAPVDNAATDSNPNRVNVNLIDGAVAGAWIG
ncbi:MAG: hypothetical protein RLZZ400_498 [Actinomycetota bacterium]|jgi:hypothetical protein